MPPWCEVLTGDSLVILKDLPDNSVDSIVTDPPAGIGFMGKAWDGDKGGRDQWIDWLAGVMTEARRVLKPGGHALIWALPRTSHWTATAVENAGFEIRDVVTHLFGTGFPKSLDISKAIDKAAGAKRPVVGQRHRAMLKSSMYAADAGGGFGEDFAITAPATDAAKQWSGWGTALKPASEHWILARKPPDSAAGTVAANVQAHGVGGLNIDGCRIGTTDKLAQGAAQLGYHGVTEARPTEQHPAGRWPANVTLDENAAAMLDEQSGGVGGHGGGTKALVPGGQEPGGYKPGDLPRVAIKAPKDAGGASRFFYVAKPSTSERDQGLDSLPTRTGGELTGRAEGSAGMENPRAGARAERKNIHPTVKSLALMRWLLRLITPPGGAVLDMFAGSGSTLCAAVLEGFNAIGIELSEEYSEIARLRVAHYLAKAPPDPPPDDSGAA